MSAASTASVAETVRAGARAVPSRAAAIVGRPLFWMAFVGVMMTWPIVRAVTTVEPPSLPVLGTIPDFSLTDQTGRAFGAADLRGRIWVANFIFTRCPTVCPRFSGEAAKLRYRARNLGDAFRMVSFSVDPEFDTPPVLAEYAARYKATPGTWLFLTGPADTLKRTVVDGFKVAMGRDSTAPASPSEFGSIFHGTHFVLVDSELRIRGYYDMADEATKDKLLTDINLVVNRGR